MKIFKYKSEWGKTYDVALKVSKYNNNGSLSIMMMCENFSGMMDEPFGVVTVNLPQSKLFADFAPNTQFVDTNNLPNIEKFLVENKIAKKGDIIGYSGFCQYPSYEFDLDAIK